MTIHLTDSIALNDSDIEEHFVRAQGARGMNPDHAQTGVELRYRLSHAALPEDVKARLTTLAGRHINRDGVLVITSRAARSQADNREAARGQLLALLLRAARAPKARKATRPRRVAREQRLADKHLRSETKTSRRRSKSAD